MVEALYQTTLSTLTLIHIWFVLLVAKTECFIISYGWMEPAHRYMYIIAVFTYLQWSFIAIIPFSDHQDFFPDL